MSTYFPVFTSIEHASIVIVGGGKNALDKIKKLSPYAPEITVIAEELLPEIEQIENIRVTRTKIGEAIRLIGALAPQLVVTADCPMQDAERIYAYCTEHRINVNTVDRPQLCTFIFPSTINRGKLTIAISTSGASPTAAVKIRERVEECLPDAVDAILDWLAELRPILQRRAGIEPKSLPQIYRALVDEAFTQNRPLDAEATEAIISCFTQKESLE